MRDTKIRWADATWNFYTGCTEVSPGCDHCYAKVIAEKYRGHAAFPNGFDITPRLHKMGEPRKIAKPSRIFVNSMSDYFHPDIPDADRDAGMAVMLEVDRHIYQILTKRPDTMRAYFLGDNRGPGWLERSGLDAVPDHIWLGTTIESNPYAWRADRLRDIPAVRFISAEPMIGPLDQLDITDIHWLIAGGESGPGYRPMDWDWARDLRDRCVAAGVAFYWKQGAGHRTELYQEIDGERWEQYPPQIARLERDFDYGARPEATRRLSQEARVTQAALSFTW